MNVRFVPNLSIRNVWTEDFSFYRLGLGLVTGYMVPVTALTLSLVSPPPNCSLLIFEEINSHNICVIVLEYSVTSLSHVLLQCGKQECSGALEPPSHVT